MENTRHTPITDPRLTAEWRRDDDGRLELMWTVRPIATWDEPFLPYALAS